MIWLDNCDYLLLPPVCYIQFWKILLIIMWEFAVRSSATILVPTSSLRFTLSIEQLCINLWWKPYHIMRKPACIIFIPSTIISISTGFLFIWITKIILVEFGEYLNIQHEQTYTCFLTDNVPACKTCKPHFYLYLYQHHNVHYLCVC